MAGGVYVGRLSKNNWTESGEIATCGHRRLDLI